MDGREWREFVDSLRACWRLLWQHRIDDRVRAEGIASEDYDLLFVDKGTVIVATRDYKPPNFREILEQHAEDRQAGRVEDPNPVVGGWGKFVREVIGRQERFTKGGRLIPSEPEKKKQQLKKGGKGWLHVRMR
ncbi:MAG: hypothetical protein ACE5L6_00235 [Candidatus Bathyarchaeia archaeon]